MEAIVDAEENLPIPTTFVLIRPIGTWHVADRSHEVPVVS